MIFQGICVGTERSAETLEFKVLFGFSSLPGRRSRRSSFAQVLESTDIVNLKCLNSPQSSGVYQKRTQ